MEWKTCRFEAMDTLFFRESRPMESIGGSELGSIFPPPVRTLAGAVRASVADADPSFTNGNLHIHDALQAVIGFGDDLGSLYFRGVWVVKDGQRLYPAPLNLIGDNSSGRLEVDRLQLGSPQDCDLGEGVCLPELPERWDGRKARSLENYWVTSATFARLLAGEIPDGEQFISAAALYQDEARLGIARDNAQRTVLKSKLYQTRHIRLHKNVRFELDVRNLPDNYAFEQRLSRLGGEGRLAQMQLTTYDDDFPHAPSNPQTSTGIFLHLLTPARFGCKQAEWLLPGKEEHWKQEQRQGRMVWRGELNGIRLTLHSMVSGRAHREGGWDMARRSPRPVQSFLPAGTTWYCTLDDNNYAAAIDALHGKQIGREQQLGRGLLAVGLWLDAPTPDGEH